MKLLFIQRRAVALFLAALFSLMLSACGGTETVDPPIFSDQNAEVTIDVSFDQLAGNIDEQKLESLLKSQSLIIEADYLPTKTIWLINANYVADFRDLTLIPIFILKPRVETIRLKQNQYQIIDHHILRFKFARQISKYYVIHNARATLPAMKHMLNWPDEPLSVNFFFNLTNGYVRAEDKTPFVHDAAFVFDSTRYALAGTVKASNVYVQVEDIKNITSETTTPSAQAALLGSKYSGYQKALLNYPLQDEVAQYLILDANNILLRRKKLTSDDSADTAHCECLPTPEQENATLEKYRSWITKYRKASDWNTVDVAMTKFPPLRPSDAVLETSHSHAKAEGHALDHLKVEIRHGEFDSAAKCQPFSDYMLFFVDRRLVDYYLKDSTCIADDEKEQVKTTHAKWNDLGQPVYFYQTCESCDNPSSQSHASEEEWATMDKFGEYVSKILKSPDLLSDTK